MMKMYGYHTIEYSNGESESEADEKIMMLSEDRLKQLLRRKDDDVQGFVGQDAVIGSPVWTIFNAMLLGKIVQKAKKGDIICHTFGKIHPDLVSMLPDCFHVETGIG